MRNRFFDLLFAQMQSDPNLVLITADLGFGLFDKFFDSFDSSQMLNIGVSEQAMVGTAAGLAKGGKTPICYSIGNFLTLRALEFFRNGAYYHNLPVKLVQSGSGLSYGQLGFTHFSTDDIGPYLNYCPNSIFTPQTLSDVDCLFSEFLYNDSPSLLRLNRTTWNGEISKCRDGLSLVGELVSPQVQIIVSQGLLQVVVDLINETEICGSKLKYQFIIPSNFHDSTYIQLLTNLDSSKKLIVIEEHMEFGGIGSKLLHMANKVSKAIEFEHIFLSNLTNGLVGDQRFLVENHLASLREVFGRLKSW